MTRTIISRSFPFFCSEFTPVFNPTLKGGTPNFKHKRKFSRFDLLSSVYHLVIEMRIKWKNGDIRLEHVCLPINFQPEYVYDSIELCYGNNFENWNCFLPNTVIRVREWDSSTTRIECELECHDGVHINYREHNFEDLMKHANCTVTTFVYLTDCIREKREIEKITMNIASPEFHEKNAPHYKVFASIQNLCGSLMLPSEIGITGFKQRKRRGASMAKTSKSGGCEVLSMTSGTFVLSTNRFKLDFRGCKSIYNMKSDIKCLTGFEMSEVVSSVYMVVLKGCIGKLLDFRCCNNYLSRRIAEWCTCTFRNDDVCDILEISNIQWNKLENNYVLRLRMGCELKMTHKFHMYISRKGSIIVRLIFANDFQWSVVVEERVVFDCNQILELFHFILSGH